MADKLTRDERSRNMSRIRSKDTKPERLVRSFLHKMGYRFRLHAAGLPGRPDIVLSKYRTVIFVHGCFWHQHQGCSRCTIPGDNRAFWIEKLNGNRKRDKTNIRALEDAGWHVIVIWECEIKAPDQLKKVVRSVANQMHSRTTENILSH